MKIPSILECTKEWMLRKKSNYCDIISKLPKRTRKDVKAWKIDSLWMIWTKFAPVNYCGRICLELFKLFIIIQKKEKTMTNLKEITHKHVKLRLQLNKIVVSI